MKKRKIVVLVGDGMGDYPVPELGGRTPLQAARIPHIRRLAAAGDLRMVQTVPVAGLSPGSDVANLGLLGYKPEDHYTGRAPIEAAGAGIPLAADDVAFRCNLVTVADGRMDDYSAGHITTEEGRQLVASVEKAMGRPGLCFHGGVSYRHLLVWKGGPAGIRTQPPHDIAGQPVADHLPAGEQQDAVRALMEQSIGLFRDHPVNRARIAAGKKPATQIWLWGQGLSLKLPTYPELYGLTGGVITAVDLIRGLGRLIGLDVIQVPGATGFLDTNYAGKVQAALDVVARHDFVFVHIEAPDECGHMGKVALKVEAIEAFDQKVVAPVWEALEKKGEPYRLLLCTDHRTPVSVRGHTREPVPMISLDGPVGAIDREAAFDEFVGGGKASGMIHERMRELLRTA
ncbi:MAG TPA: cofactor-independent phosphoglycerate mutase [Kiritimatiellia bacterium]|nr:cofactor-independent phosphoglycerate mutase [Kiritimatiellia bacterium]HRZ11980.1 cofactor-independent phosphoglycerate mutase [Kiritimatiellia bacterium]HSA17214.1 cofactor-independent phosphoglycerate mutase [Kiritimatiellia bacterium]